jgi:hypothetical protein
MDILGTLPVWTQLVIVVLVAAVLIFMNIGWLIQARAWLTKQGQRRPGAFTPTPGAPTSTTRSQRDRV